MLFPVQPLILYAIALPPAGAQHQPIYIAELESPNEAYLLIKKSGLSADSVASIRFLALSAAKAASSVYNIPPVAREILQPHIVSKLDRLKAGKAPDLEITKILTRVLVGTLVDYLNDPAARADTIIDSHVLHRSNLRPDADFYNHVSSGKQAGLDKGNGDIDVLLVDSGFASTFVTIAGNFPWIKQIAEAMPSVCSAMHEVRQRLKAGPANPVVGLGGTGHADPSP